MPVSQSTRLPTLIKMVRQFLRDTPKANELRGVVESTDEDIFMSANMALDYWNSTPPLIAYVSFDNHPSFNWLIVATAMFILQSAGVLNYRNDLAFSDNGITINPWTKGPAYFNTAAMWANMVDNKVRDIKMNINIMAFSGVVPSSEYFAWDYQNYQYAGFGGTEGGVPLTGLPPTAIPDPTVAAPTPNKTSPFTFDISTWVFNSGNNEWNLNFNHNLNFDEVDVRIVDPSTNQDLRSKPSKILFINRNMVQLVVPASPDGRFVASIQVYKIL